MAIVTDAAVFLALAFQDEATALAEAVLKAVQSEGAFVPALFWFEIRNVLITSERRGRITPEHTHAFLQSLSIQRIEVDIMPPESAVLTLARRHNLTVYDSAYLELAQRKRAPLATLDAALIRAAAAEKVEIFNQLS